MIRVTEQDIFLQNEPHHIALPTAIHKLFTAQRSQIKFFCLYDVVLVDSIALQSIAEYSVKVLVGATSSARFGRTKF